MHNRYWASSQSGSGTTLASDIIIPMKIQFLLVLVLLACAAAQPPLPGPAPLTTQGDLAAQMVGGINDYLLRQSAAAPAGRARLLASRYFESRRRTPGPSNPIATPVPHHRRRGPGAASQRSRIRVFDSGAALVGSGAGIGWWPSAGAYGTICMVRACSWYRTAHRSPVSSPCPMRTGVPRPWPVSRPIFPSCAVRATPG